MPRNINQVGYGKISITSDEPLEKLITVLDKLLKEHGYPEEKRVDSKIEEDFQKMMQEPLEGEKLAQTKPRKL